MRIFVSVSVRTKFHAISWSFIFQVAHLHNVDNCELRRYCKAELTDVWNVVWSSQKSYRNAKILLLNTALETTKMCPTLHNGL